MINLFFYKNLSRATCTFQSRQIDELYDAVVGDDTRDTGPDAPTSPPPPDVEPDTILRRAG